MSTPVPKTAALADRAATRAMIRDIVKWCGRGFAVGAGAAVILIGADRLFGDWLWHGSSAWPWILGVAVGAGGGVGLAIAVARRISASNAAFEVDRALGLNERLTSGLGLVGRDGFAVIAAQDAEQAAGRVVLSRAIPIQPERWWAFWPTAAAAAVTIGLFAPRVQWGTSSDARVLETAQIRAAADDVRGATETAREAVQDMLSDRGLIDVASAEQLQQLESLERDLLSEDVGADEARVKAAQTLEQLADGVQSAAARDRAASQALREQFADAPEVDEGGSSPLEQALRSGDMHAAREAANNLLAEIAQLDEAGRKAAAAELDEIARRLEPVESDSADDSPPAGPTEDEPAATALDPTGASAPDRSGQTDPEQIRKRLESQGVPPEDAAPLAEQLARENRERALREEAQRQARQDAEELRESLRDAAREARGEPPRSDKPSGKNPPDSAREQPANRSPRDEQQPGDAKNPEGKPDAESTPRSDAPGAKPSKSPTQKPGDASNEQPDKPHGGKPGDRPGDDGSGSQRGNQPSEQPGHQPTDRPGGQPGDSPGDKPSNKPSNKPANKPANRPGDEPGDDSQGRPGENGTSDPNGKPEAKPGTQPGAQLGGDQGSKPNDDSAPKEPSGNEEGPGQGKPGDGPTGENGAKGAQKPDPNDGIAPGTDQPGGPPAQSSDPGAGPNVDDGAGASESPTGEKLGGKGANEKGPEGGSAPGGTEDPNPGRDTSPDPSPNPGQGGAHRLQEQMDRLAERDRKIQEAPRVSRELREKAQRLLEQASDEEKRSLERWARQAARERDADTPPPAQPWAGETDLVDAREPQPKNAPTPPDPSERVIAEWFSNQGVDRSGAAAGAALQQEIGQASKGAEEAIEQQAVPRRHSEMIRRVFGRYTQRAKGQNPPAVKDATDAPRPAGDGK